MTFNYSEEQIAEIESLGLTVEQFDRILSDISQKFGLLYEKVIEIVRSMCGCISDAWEQMKELIDRMEKDIQTVEVKHQYRFIKTIGYSDYVVYLNDKKLYRARSNI